MNTPVVFMVFNRPEPTRRVLERIRQAQPPKLLVVCDGARPGVPTDAGRVAEVRALIAQGVDWPCEVLTNYAPANLGCRERVATGLNWAFSQVEEAIILEDDCLPDPSFFPYCEELLTRYRDDPRVMHIGGGNLATRYLHGEASYWFSHQTSIWGWATWRRAWCHYDLEMTTWDARADALRSSFSSRWETHFWLPIFNQTRLDHRKTNTWDFSWAYTCRSLHGLCIVPRHNLVANIGFGDDSTHTATTDPRLQLPSAPCGPMRHPRKVKWNRYGDELLTMAWGGQRIDFAARLWARLRVWREPSRDQCPPPTRSSSI